MELSCCLECVYNSPPDYNRYHVILFRLLKTWVADFTSKVDMEKNLNMQPGLLQDLREKYFKWLHQKQKEKSMNSVFVRQCQLLRKPVAGKKGLKQKSTISVMLEETD